MNKIYASIVICIGLAWQANAQLDAPKLILPNPESFSFTKYGDVPIGLFTGTMNYSVPLIQLQSGKISIPVSLDYATNGVKVDEVSGRTGLGWNLHAGGVITRTIIGKADESLALTAPSTNDSLSSTFYNYMKLVTQNQSNTQPDEYTYSFAGYSGKFYYGYNGSVVQLSASGIKIEKYNLGTAFKLTTPDGFQYFFTVTEYSDSYSAYTEVDPMYTTGQGGYTAWYLTKIVSTSGDVVNLKYTGVGTASMETPIEYFSSYRETAVVYSSTYRSGSTTSSTIPDIYLLAGNCTLSGQNVAGQIAFGHDFPECVSGPTFTMDFNKSKIVPVKLTEINFNQGTLKFFYSSRDDLPGEEKLDSLVLYSIPANKKIKVVQLGYAYSQSSSYNMPLSYSPYPYNNVTSFQDLNLYLKKRLFLQNISFVNVQDYNDKSLYQFQYDSYNALPPRLSFAQDKFGYFNGKVNAGFIPTNSIISQYIQVPVSGANREVDTNYSGKGVLNKITYPTGGYTDVKYQSNSILSNYRRVDDSVVTTINYSESQTIVYSPYFKFDYPVNLNVTGSWVSPPPPRGEFDLPLDEDSFAVVSLIDSATNVCWVCDVHVRTGDGFIISQNFANLDNRSTYRLKLQTDNSNVKARAVFSRYSINQNPYNAPAGGVRVAQIKNYATTGSLASYKIYDYNDNSGTPGSNNFSSGSLINNYQDNRDFYQLKYDNCSPEFYGAHYELSSSSAIGGFINDYLSVNYQYVTEYQDSAANNGSTINQFKIVANQLPTTFLCAPFVNNDSATHHSHHLIPGAPYTNSGALNGKPIRQVFYKNQAGTQKKIRDILSYYSIDSRLYNADSFYVIRKTRDRYPAAVGVNYFGDYDINKYKRISAWVHADSTVEKEYDDNNIELTTKTLYSYENSNHLQATKVATIRSKGDTSYKKTKFAQDLSLTTLAAKNFITVPILTQTYVSQTLLTTGKINYKIIDSIIVVDSFQKSTLNNPLETELKFTQYDKYGNPLEFLVKGQVSAMLFDTCINTMVAGSQNASLNEIAYTSFETAYPGNWSIPSSVRDSVTATITGKKSYNFSNGSIVKNNLVWGKTYSVSYWSQSGAISISGGSGTIKTGRTINGWTYYDHSFTVSATSITLTGLGLIDELRLTPAGNQMTSYVFDPLVGQTSMSDANGEITYYEYDGLGRLKNIKDYQGNILKNFQYHYATN